MFQVLCINFKTVSRVPLTNSW